MRLSTKINVMTLLLVLSLSFFAIHILPAESSPVGKWKTFDDKTGQAKSIVQISEREGKLQGKVLELINPPEPNPRCEDCPGDSKDKPIIGLTILWDMKKAGAEWKGGKIMDPENGKVYKCLLRLKEGGKKLEVRGFIGFSALGRSQTWARVE
jgi:uncharacterized protein (DUF2147 family)